MPNRYDVRMRELRGHFTWDKSGEQPYHLTEEQIDHAEQQLGARLPGDYREFVRDYGLFSVPTVLYPMQENDDHIREGSLELFYGIALDERYMSLRIDRAYENMCGNEDWPVWLMPIGIDGGSSTIGMSIKGENKGSIYLYVNESVFSAENYFFITSSFDEFMNIMYTNPDLLKEIEDLEARGMD